MCRMGLAHRLWAAIAEKTSAEITTLQRRTQGLAMRTKGDIEGTRQRLRSRVPPVSETGNGLQRDFVRLKGSHKAALRDRIAQERMKTVAGSNPIAAATQSLKALAGELTQALSRFRLTSEPA